MTTPTSGPIAFSNINAETGAGAGGFSSNMNWVKNNAKTTAGGSTGVINDLGSVYNKAYYASNMNTVCNNDNNGKADYVNCNCGNIANGNCLNCTELNCTALNCTNNDTQKYLQPNCNCNCTFNCSVSGKTKNCNCDCWVCACTW